MIGGERHAVARALSAILLAAGVSACARPEPPPPRPEEIRDFAMLYAANCAGCHGTDGRRGAAQPLNDALYLAIVRDAPLRDVIARGIPGTPMSAFGVDAGGTLTDAQVNALVEGMRKDWGNGPSRADASLPAYSKDDAVARGLAPADIDRGRAAYRRYCARCHGGEGKGGPSAGSIVDDAFLSLMSDQALRTTVIVGRADEMIPGWREYVPGQPMTNQEILDVVAWLSAQRGIND